MLLAACLQRRESCGSITPLTRRTRECGAVSITYYMSTASSNQSALVERLFRVGAHFGFKKSRRHPTVVPYLLGSKNGNDIFDLNHTAELITAAKSALTTASANGKTVMFVGTKEEIRHLVKEAAVRANMPHVENRWIGGMLTNFSEIKKRLARLEELRREEESGEQERKYTKRERVLIGREIDKLSFNFAGMATLQRVPDMLIVVDPRHEQVAVAEARELNIPIIAVMSSDCDAAVATHPIVVNDALQSSVSLVLGELAAAISEGAASATPSPVSAEARAGATPARA